MKKIMIAILAVSVLACTNKQEPITNSAPATNEPTAQVPLPDSVTVDASTAATSRVDHLSFNGIIVMPPQRLATVALTLSGVVKSTSILPGQRVQQGSVLATIENPEFIELQQVYLDSYAQTDYLRTEYERQKTLAQEQAASQKKYQQSKADYLSMKSRLEASAAQLSLLHVSTETLRNEGIQPLLQVKAPISGYIGSVDINVGKYIHPGDALCEIIDKSNPLLKLTAYEKDLASLKVGSAVEFRVNGMGEQVFNATILSIGQQVDKASRSLDVYARVIDTNQQFPQGMYVMAQVKK